MLCCAGAPEPQSTASSKKSPAKAVFRAVMANSPEQLRELVQSGAPVSGPTAINSAGKSPKEVARNRSKALALAYLEETFELTVTSVTDGTGFQVEGLTLDTTVPQLRAKVAELRGVEPEAVRLVLVDGSEQAVLHDKVVVMSNAHDVEYLGKKASTTEDQTLGGSGVLHRRWAIRMAMRDAASAVEEEAIAAAEAARIARRATIQTSQRGAPRPPRRRSTL